MIERGAADWNWGLNVACFRGNKELALFMIEKGASDLTRGLYTVVQSGYKELMLALILLGADIDVCVSPFSWSSPNTDDIDYLIKSGLTRFGTYSSLALQRRQDIDYIKYRLSEVMISVLADLASRY
jgi:hypothetical protein